MKTSKLKKLLVSAVFMASTVTYSGYGMEKTENRNGTITLSRLKTDEHPSPSWLDSLTNGAALFVSSLFEPIVTDVNKNIEKNGIVGTAWNTTKSVTTDVAEWTYNNPLAALVQVGVAALGLTNIGETTSLAQYGLPTSIAQIAVGGAVLAQNSKTLVDIVDKIPDGKVGEALQTAAYLGIAYYVITNIPTATGLTTLGTPFSVNGPAVPLGTPTSVAVVDGGNGQNIIGVSFPSSSEAIQARLFWRNGTAITSQLAVSTATSGTRTPVSLAGSPLSSPQGTFLAAWPNGATANVRILDTGGNFLMSQTIIDGVTPPTAVGNPLATGTADGNFKIGYIATNGGRIFYENSIASNATVVYSQTNIGVISSGNQYTLGGNAPLANGNNLYCFIDSSSSFIQSVEITPSGSIAAGGPQLNQFTPVSTPVCAGLTGGTKQVVWNSGATTLVLRNANSAGNPVGNEITLVSGSTVSAPRIVALKNDYSLLTYGLTSGTTDFTGVILNANGANVTSPFTIASNSQGFSIAPLPRGTGASSEDVAAIACYQDTSTATLNCRTISATLPPQANTTSPNAGTSLTVGAATIFVSLLSLFFM